MKLRYHSDSSSFYDNDDEDLDSALLCFNLAILLNAWMENRFEVVASGGVNYLTLI